MALIHIDAMPSGEVVSSKDLAERYDLPADLVGKVLQALGKSGLIEAVHGSRGGYRAGRPLDDISLGDVIVAIEGPMKLVRCQHDSRDCVQFSSCGLREPIQQLHGQLQEFLYGVSIARFRKANPEPAGVGG